ncbi:uncharacterized protein LOC108255589 isoform X1 [Ictalurus punctatus]|uniref:Uncharacterized protein LOC108255589 isoform X1 n=1 Tax=Ictalurus punctatus TaxID=7998 RepID=A0A2D0PMA2_ICTPU|nr:uncharacterized protein LOC108255589 isoform X1 [Ictalurus punctatus]
MVQFKTLPVFLCAMGFISETLCSLTLEAEAGDNVTIWCQHGLTKTGFIFWFKHTSDSVPLRLGCKKFRTSAPSENCYFFTESERIVMSDHGKNTSLTITAVTVSDTGLYYCSFSDKMIFSNSTSLQVKGVNKTFSEDKATDSDSSAVFFMLNAVFSAVIVILLCVLIFIILKNRKTLRGAEAEDIEVADSDSEHYTALQSSTKNTKRTRRHDEKVYTHVVYSSISLSNLFT